TGFATTGSPAAMYWSTFNPHLPRLQSSSGTHAIPTSAAASSFASVASDHQQGMTRRCRKDGKRSQMTFNDTPGTDLPMSLSIGAMASSPCSVLEEPTHTSCNPFGAQGAFGAYREVSTHVGITVTRSGEAQREACAARNPFPAMTASHGCTVAANR